MRHPAEMIRGPIYWLVMVPTNNSFGIGDLLATFQTVTFSARSRGRLPSSVQSCR